MTQADSSASQEAPASTDLEGALSAADVEWRALAQDDDTFLVDGVRPRYVCTPGTVDAVAATMRAAGRAGTSVIPWGGGTRMSLGFPPRAGGLVLKTERLREIVEYEPADLTVTVQAGMRLSELQERLRAATPSAPASAPLPLGGTPTSDTAAAKAPAAAPAAGPRAPDSGARAPQR